MGLPEIRDYQFEGEAVRMHVLNDEPWFVLADVCRVLEIRNVTQAAARLDEDERSMLNIGRQGEAIIVNESGLYSLILSSRKPAARRFKKWVTAEVLPTLRRTGAYVMAPGDENLPELADGKVFGMKVAKVNAAARLISVANAIYGPEAARALWEAEGGLPQLSSKTISALAGTAEDDPVGCFRHLIRFAAGNGRSVGQVLSLAMHDKMAARMLPALGMIADPVEAKGFLAVANDHPFLAEVFSQTQWLADWKIALAQLPGARPSRGNIAFGTHVSAAVLIPRATVLSLLSPTRH